MIVPNSTDAVAQQGGRIRRRAYRILEAAAVTPQMMASGVAGGGRAAISATASAARATKEGLSRKSAGG